VARRRTLTKRGPDPPDLTADLDPAPGGFHSGVQWECVFADGDTEVGPQLVDIVVLESVWSNADLTGRHLTNLRCRDVHFDRCDLSGAVLEAASLTRVMFTGCRMSGVVLSGARLQDVYIRDCRVDLANFRMAHADFLLVEDCSLREAEFNQAVLTRSALRYCDLSSANFQDCTLTDVDLHDSTVDGLRGALSLGGASISPSQLIALAPALATAAGINVTPAARWQDC
jgi:uncharacterized protein YjbI with pentapeptide repeats